MKKSVALLSFLLTLLFSLSSCSHIIKYELCHPVNHPMSKWEGNAEGLDFELYIGDEEHKDFMVIDYGNEKISYLVWWHQNYLSEMSINDVRKSSPDENESSLHQNLIICWGGWDIKLIDETHFKLTNEDVQILDARCDIPEATLPNEIVMTRTQSDIDHENFPKIERDEAYDLCPAYRYGTQWVSDDNKIVIDKINSYGDNTAGTSKVTFAEEPNSVYYIGFFEVGFKAYLMKWEEDSLFYFSKRKFVKATEEWQCEYFENHFIARVIRSEHYEPGQILTFSLVETFSNSNE